MAPLAAKSAQRAIFYVQRELEMAAEGAKPAVMLCDRGTVDGSAYWRGEPDLWTSVGTTLGDQLGRYSAVIHLRVPSVEGGYDRSNPLRLENADEAKVIDTKIAALWSKHACYFAIEPQSTFIEKAAKVLEKMKKQIPECCAQHITGLKSQP